MLRKSKIILLIYALAAAGLVYYAYPIVKKRYLSKPEPKKSESSIPKPNEEPQKIDNTESASDAVGKEEEKNKEPIEEEEFLEITKNDCDNKCENFKSDADELEYCREICGFTAKKAAGSCGELEGLEKDYCLKDLAISEKDFKICEQIGDLGIKKSCKNRVTEEILNGKE
ncbi:MAG: hypothetical protein A3J63_02875 [Candidatus Moranbacteria bacterium RIFCSPHIGHO2_02_FULL_40_12b]|nr:MAG: hypothetical protein A3J63_02875 [Candidatus Moranbacteria bacterium RIFCSPHIGHO2_02_FULL_40_12b]